ncbi:hypothetical protein DLM78_17290 [Leptospira stimsonii]|uniref:Uncharacterized protein n=1 Tax=Leptospira stimsonii TaxID=2202203 RepID=A0A8B3CPM0_9LEPT|nr:hypothetical protein DLM78_17290 [Leptospira stimsonii]
MWELTQRLKIKKRFFSSFIILRRFSMETQTTNLWFSYKKRIRFSNPFLFYNLAFETNFRLPRKDS